MPILLLHVQTLWAGAKYWGDLAASIILAVAAIIHPFSHQKNIFTESVSVSCSPEVWDWRVFPACHFPPSPFTGQHFLEHHKKNMEFLSSLCGFVVFTTSPPFLGQGPFRHKCGLGIAPQNSNQELSPILVGKSQHRTGEPIMTKSRILVLSLKPWLKISVQISLANYTEISFIQSITQDLQAHTSNQFVLCDSQQAEVYPVRDAACHQRYTVPLQICLTVTQILGSSAIHHLS